MEIPPVIVRELREEARRPATGWTRMLAVGAVLFILIILWGNDDIHEGRGGELFSRLNVAFCVAIWLIVPAATADCISREKREGTLPLLFLTPLTPTGVIAGKVVCHALRAFGLLLAVLPAMLICSILGGLSWRVGAVALAMDSVSIILALCSGLVASAFCRQWNRAVGFAMLNSALLLVLYALTLTSACEIAFSSTGRAWRLERFTEILFQIGFGGDQVWNLPKLWPLANPTPPLQLWATILAFVVLATLFSVRVAVHQICRARRFEPPSRRRQDIQEAVWKPRFWQGRFRRRKNRLLDRNPIGWLQRYATSSRVIGLCWLLGVIAFEAWMFREQNTHYYRHYRELG